MNEHEQGYGVIKDVKQAKEAAKQALQDGLGGWFPAACVVLAKALDDAEKRAAPQAEPSDEELLELGKQIEQSIDPRYEFVDVVRTLLARYGQPRFIEIETTPVHVTLGNDGRALLDVRNALRKAGAPLCHEDGRMMTLVEKVEWLARRSQPAASADRVALADELAGVVADVEQGKGFDRVCLDTIKRVRNELLKQPAASAEPREVDMDEYQAMLAVMEQIDPATFPGLTAAQRCALGRFAKPLSALPQRSAGE